MTADGKAEYQFNGVWYKANENFIVEETPAVQHIITLPNVLPSSTEMRYVKLAHFDNEGNLVVSEDYTPQYKYNGDGNWYNPGENISVGFERLTFTTDGQIILL